MRDKIRSLDELVKIREVLQKERKKVVTINGSFDVLHLGHIRMLGEAKAQGDTLIVGLNSDRSIKEYKSIFRPVNNQDNRAEFMAALECVDYVFIFDETVPMPFLAKLRPDIHVNGSEYGKDCIERETVEKNGGEIYVVKLVDGFSTTEMIRKMTEIAEKEKEFRRDKSQMGE